MHLHGFDYVLSDDSRTLALQSQDHNLRITEVGEITGPRSLSIQHYSGGQILIGVFRKLASSIVENYGENVKSVDNGGNALPWQPGVRCFQMHSMT